MTNYFYSPTTNGFYAEELREFYESAQTWPSDAFMVSGEVYDEFQIQLAPAKKVRTSSPKGTLIWVDAAPPTLEEIIADATNKLASLLAHATTVMAPLQDALDIGDATEEELTLLKAWKTYRVLLNRLDLSTAPDIIWPEIPA